MKKILDTFDFEKWREDREMEFKLAAGRDGKGGLPRSLWETYSSMANSVGGTIILGIDETSNGLVVEGVANPEKVLKDFWNTINNPEKVSCNLLTDDLVSVVSFRGKQVIQIDVPRASRKSKPVYIGHNPLTGTYRRQNEGDYHCPDHIVRRMMAERESETLDDVIFNKYTLEDDIDLPSLAAYRQMFINRQPVHPFNTLSDFDFLQMLGCHARNRETGEEGLTLAGLLMFGKLRSILEKMPNYVVDFREYGRDLENDRWIDRVTTDFTWSGNLFTFCRLVLPKLYASLKVPFALSNGIRVDDTPVHVAIREAVVNTLIHADYGESTPVLIIKRPDLFGFRNPGTLRIPKEDAVRGGISDCRNRTLQKMFQLIGFAEQAGSGFPKIMSGWQSQDWKRPEFREDFANEQTYLALRMTSLFPTEIVSHVRTRFGRNFDALSALGRLIVVTAFSEHTISHGRILELSTDHPADVTNELQKLVKNGFLTSEGRGRGMVYHPAPDDEKFGEGPSRDQAEGPSRDQAEGPSRDQAEGPSRDQAEGPSRDQVEEELTKDQMACLHAVATEKTVSELLHVFERANRTKFRQVVLKPLLSLGFVEMTIPQTPNSPYQKYRLSPQGHSFIQKISSHD